MTNKLARGRVPVEGNATGVARRPEPISGRLATGRSHGSRVEVQPGSLGGLLTAPLAAADAQFVAALIGLCG
jgi:hypothetical protein